MKKLFIALVSLSMLASCSLDKELQQNEGNPISFTSEIGTRATSFVTTDNMNYFYSTAFNSADEVYFDKLLFNKNGEYFTSDPEYYWPGDGSELRFYCYASSGLSSEMGLTEPEGTAGEYMLKNVTPKTDISQQVDFVYGYAVGSKADETNGLKIKMRHGFTQIALKAKNSNQGYVYTVTGVKLACVAESGNFKFPVSSENKGSWTPGDDKTNYVVTYAGTPKTLDGTYQNIMGATGNIVFVPQQPTAWVRSDKTNTQNGAYFAVKINVTTKAGAQVYEGWSAINIGDNWKQGMIYTYLLDFSTGAGFVDPMDPGTPGNPGDEILGGPIKFSLESVINWENHTPDSEVEM